MCNFAASFFFALSPRHRGALDAHAKRARVGAPDVAEPVAKKKAFSGLRSCTSPCKIFRLTNEKKVVDTSIQRTYFIFEIDRKSKIFDSTREKLFIKSFSLDPFQKFLIKLPPRPLSLTRGGACFCYGIQGYAMPKYKKKRHLFIYRCRFLTLLFGGRF